MKIVDHILDKIEASIKDNHFVNLENEKIELKDNSHSASEWNEVFITGCAFLNTDGGVIIIGIKEKADKDNKRYTVTGFDQRNEEKIKTIAEQFTDEEGVRKNVGSYIRYHCHPNNLSV